jgi:hypothetical protein
MTLLTEESGILQERNLKLIELKLLVILQLICVQSFRNVLREGKGCLKLRTQSVTPLDIHLNPLCAIINTQSSTPPARCTKVPQKAISVVDWVMQATMGDAPLEGS